METGLCEVLSVPFFLLSLPSASTSVTSSFVTAIQGGWGIDGQDTLDPQSRLLQLIF